MQTTKILLNIEKIQKEIPFGLVNYFQAIDSTNSWLVENGKCGDICISEMQNKGRGRRGNKWVSPKTGNIYLSLCWCFQEIPKHWTLLGLVVGVAIAEVLAEIGLKNHGIKWPNDVFWKDNKLGGILIETLDQSGVVIIGIGLNKMMSPEHSEKIDQKVIGLDELLPKGKISREELITKLIIKLHQHLTSFKTLQFDKFISSWKTWDILLDETVSFKQYGEEITGKVVDIDQYGRLGVQIKTGAINYFSSAEIKIRRSDHANTIG